MDGVIVDTYAAHVDSIMHLFQRHGREISVDTVRAEIFGRANREWIPDFFPDCSGTACVGSLSAEKEAIFLQSYLTRARPLPGLRELLSDLRAASVPCAVASMAPHVNVTDILRETGLAHYFEAVLTERHVSRGKPDPEVFLAAARELGVPADRCVAFDDTPIGLLAARRAGCRVIGVATTHPEGRLTEADRVVRDLGGVSVRDLAQMMGAPCAIHRAPA